MANAEDKLKAREFTVNGQTAYFDDNEVEGRDILNAVGLVPASEYQLILVKDRRTRLIGADTTLNLKKEAGGVLRAFRSDRTFSFTVDEISQLWGVAEMDVDEFLRHWPAPEGKEWVLELENEPDTVLRSGGTLNFEPEGVEDILSRQVKASKVLVTVFTTSGTFPAQGALRVDVDEVIATVLERAAKKLKLTSTAGWVVQVDGNDVNPSLTFAQAGLSGEIDLEWGAREGGGGA
ncbi:multiubiquitin domain-containing protein [Rhizobium leguminosarum]|jgi:hypothetical protein|uniref:multiubiquitin domain-containing protein n=1 Tax=Rhizobium leguminosarum TaxID=384 RepID=UPI00103211B7|nr:multiubiquitin domain-containing protein [Rhizobium leguminosarum]TAV76226.1 hypothetical protein ELI28_23025 [Rhizobium leguminosarum]TAV80825.1 hypothetical protein ELI27_23010 [Rhizobium leguminosarum]TAZ32551.1 hypothetical protein ELH73_23015 [Rhizobium leguminosarum]